MTEQQTNQEEFKIVSEDGYGLTVVIPTRNLGKLPDRAAQERIISGREIKSWERDSWPPLTSSGVANISGSLGFMDFKAITISELECCEIDPLDNKFLKGGRNKNRHDSGDYGGVDFPYLGEKALEIGMLGIEPSGCRRMRDKIRNNIIVEDNEKNLILGSLLNKLENIAAERQIPIITVDAGSLYNFYGGSHIVYPIKMVQSIYNNSYSKVKFQILVNKKGKFLYWKE